MTARSIDGAALARDVRAGLGERIRGLPMRPGLAILLVGDDPASDVYVRTKVGACEETGIAAVLERHPADLSEHALLTRIAALNADRSVHGVLVQMPLPKHLSAARVIEAIDPRKDVDGFSTENMGRLVAGLPGLRPATPWGCMRLIESTGIAVAGRHAVVIGRSHTVGKPMALMLLAADATVTVCHSRTPDLAGHVRRADIVVAAVGRRRTVTADMVKPGAVVIDVGTNRIPDGEPRAGKLCGDVDFDAVREVAAAVTPVPGGVGPMTVAMLLANTVDAAEAAQAAEAAEAAARRPT